MKKKINNNLIVIINVIVLILFIIPSFKLNLFDENYSTLSLTTKGYLYVLFLGIAIGILLAYEMYIITNNKINALLMFLSLLIGTIVPHHVPYNLQGNLHMLFAYIGFVGLVIMTTLNIKNIKVKSIYFFMLFVSVAFYLKCSMVNTLSEIIVMISSLLVNLYSYISIVYLK